MYYEINIAKNGKHYFATAPQSLSDFLAANELYKDLIIKFPPSEGYNLTLTRWEKTGKVLTTNG